MKLGFSFAPGTPAKLTVAIGLAQMDPTVLVMTSLSTQVEPLSVLYWMRQYLLPTLMLIWSQDIVMSL